MGRYIIPSPAFGKPEIISACGGIPALCLPDRITPDSDIVYICIVLEHSHEAALVVEDDEQLARIQNPDDWRPKFLMVISRDNLTELEKMYR